MKSIKFIIIAIIFFAAGFFLGQSYQIPSMVSVNESANQVNLEPVTYVISFSESNLIEFQNISLSEKATVLDILNSIAAENEMVLETEDYENLGTLVTKIGEMENGQENKYWQYFVNDQLPQVGASSFLLAGGERVEWKFMEYEEISK